MKIITIGRSSSNDIIIKDPLVSRIHCQIIEDDNGNFRLIDTDSKNGTFINGIKRRGEIPLNKSDVVRIGNTTLPWRSYFPPIPVPKPIPPSDSDFGPGSDPNPATGLGIVALIVSLVGAGLLLFASIRILKWGIIAWIGGASTFVLLSVCINIIAYIIASIADYKSHEDSATVGIAKWIAGFCIFLVVGFFLYWKFIDPNLMNPFKNIL